MNDENMTKEKLFKEPEDIRKRIAGLKSAEEDETGDPELAEILDNPAIQSLMDSFHEFAHIPMAIVDLNGKVLAGPGWGDICKKFHRVHPETCRHCIDSDTQLSAGVPAGEYRLYKCKNNMWDVATPIIIGDRHVGNVISGQFFFDDESIDYDLFRSQARKYGFPEEAYIAALETVPRFSRKSLDAGMAFFMKLAGMISQLSYGNIRLVRSLAERDALMNSLQTAEEKYRGIFENATEGIYRTTPAGDLLEVNPAFAEILGYDSPEEIKNAVTNIGQQVYVNSEDREKWISVLDQQEYARFEVPWHRRDGSICWVCLRARVVRNEEGKPICYEGFAEDVTERRKFVEELEQHREHLECLVKERTTQLAETENIYRTIFENTGNATLIFEEDTTISLTNGEFENLFHFTRDETEGKKSWTELVPAEDVEWLLEYHRLRRIDSKAVPGKYELRVVNRDGIIRNVYMTIAMIPGTKKSVASFMDITTLKEAENALRESEMHYRALFDHAGVAIVHVDAQGNFLSVNDNFVEFIGYSREELKNLNARNVTYTKYLEQTEDLIAKQIDGEIDQFTQEKYYIRKDGALRWGEMRSTPIRDEQGRLLSAVIAIIDRTEQKQAEDNLKKYAEEITDLYENAPFGYHSLAADGTVIRMNNTELSWLGYSRDEVVGKMKMTDLLMPEGVKIFQQAFPLLKKQGWLRNIENQLRRKDGSLFDVILNVTAIYDENGDFRMSRASVFDNTERKQAENALAESETLYRNLFENAAIGMFQSTLEGRFLRINKAYASMLGYESPEEVISTITDTATQIHADSGNRTALLDTLEKQGWCYAEQPYLRKDGSSMIGNISIRKVVKDDGSVAYLEGIIEDITERKRAEEKLMKYTEEITDLYENAPCGYQSLAADGTIIRMNNTALSWLGYSRDEVIGKMNITDIITPKGLEQLEHNRQLFIKQGWLHDIEDQWIRKDGSILDIILDMTAVYDKNGNYLMNRVSVFDNTERKRAEEALAESETLYRNLFENASIGMFQTSPEGKFLHINKALASMFGYESTEEVMSTITDTATQIHADPQNRAAFLAALEQQDWFYAEQPYLRKDGSTMIGKLAIRKVLNSDGSIAYLEGIVEDITERKRAEEALKESERELRTKAQNLMEVNTTMKVLLNTMEKDQDELKERFLTNIKEQVLPYLAKLKKTPLDGVQQGFIRMAESSLDDIASPFVQKLTSNYLNLTKKEVQVASLIKEGKTSKEIAEILNSNLRVVSFHRENIRRKLGMKHQKGNLQIVLRSYL